LRSATTLRSTTMWRQPVTHIMCRQPILQLGKRRLLCSAASADAAAAKSSSGSWQWCAANPIKFGVGIATVKTQAADLLTQKAIEGKSWDNIDWKRNGLFTVFGFAYQGCFQYYLYVTLFSRWFAGAARFANQPFRAKLADHAGQIDVLKQCLFDVLIHPIWFFPMYYTLKEALCSENSIFTAAKASASAITTSALTKYYQNNFDPSSPEGLLSDWLAFWKVWVIGDIVVYGCVPLWARLPANHAFSFVYICILSFMRGAEAPAADGGAEPFAVAPIENDGS